MIIWLTINSTKLTDSISIILCLFIRTAEIGLNHTFDKKPSCRNGGPTVLRKSKGRPKGKNIAL